MKLPSMGSRQPALPPCFRLISALIFVISLASAQTKLTVDQLVTFVQSSIKLKHPDRQVASYLSKLKLSERLNMATVEDLQGQGAGHETVQALKRLSEASMELPAAPPKIEKPAPPPIPPPPLAEQKAILEQVREYAMNYSKSLPNFLCTQVVRRYYDDTGTEVWSQMDTLTARLSFFEQKEDYKLVMINNRSTTQSYQALGGATSSGEFGSMLHELFEPKTQATFQWLRWATLRGKRAHVYSYRVEQVNSQWHLNFDRRQEIVVGYSGLVYVDRDTGVVLKVTLEGDNIPSSFPISQASNAVDYDFTKIGEQTFLLPLKAEVRMRTARMTTRNLMEFRLYRKFGADTSITFETPEALPDDATKEQPAK